MNSYVERLKTAADPTRIRILRILAMAPDALCVCELVDILRKPQYAVSRSLSNLRKAGLVEEERRGKLMFYRSRQDAFNERLLACLREVPADSGAEQYDADRLRWRLDLRSNGECVVTYTRGYNPPEYRAAQLDTAAGSVSGRPDSVPPKRRVLFVCVHNSARSQMAEEYLRRFGGDLFEVESAGLEPGTLNPYVVEVMREEGMDISGKATRAVFDVYRAGRSYSAVITVCDREAEEKCPVFPGPVQRLSWPFEDPSSFTGSREEILARTREIRDQVRARVLEFIQAERREA